MKTALANLPWQRGEFYGVRAGSRWPFMLKTGENKKREYVPFPFFLAYATSLLKKNSKKAVLVDAVAESLDETRFIQKIIDFSPDLIVAETSTPSFNNDIMILKDLSLKLPACRIALSGPHADVFSHNIMQKYSFINYVLTGEYEYTVLELMNCLENNNPLGDVSGLVYRKNGLPHSTPPRSLIEKLDDLPWPEREDVPIYSYNDGFARIGGSNVQVWSSRGCPFGCIYCLWPQVVYKNKSYRKRAAEEVLDEIEYLIKNFKFNSVNFDDDIFNADREHVLDICREFKKRKVSIPWTIMARADYMDQELLEEMRSSGLHSVKYGIESADEGILSACNKRMDIAWVKDIIKITKELGIRVHLTFCIG
ncbi:MAG: radical SAM protein, partial [Candidatus Omnitrophica bacterium]|nr:radical SAM protein [Candidatus Omnitrophota bacterium]MBD3268967.1 radical SAM protein [Candidatus Omnitrophota bacterium]